MQLKLTFELCITKSPNFRFKLEEHWQTSTVFILNLAALELMFCVVCMPTYIFIFAETFWPHNITFCKFIGAFTLLNAHTNWLSIGLIAVTRCVGLMNKRLWERFCSSGKNIALLCIFPWVWSLLINLPQYIDPSVEFGFHCQLGKCDLIPTGVTPVLPKAMLVV